MRQRGTAGFTLIEIMIVVIIIAIMGAMVLPRLTGRTEEARRKRAQVDIANVESAIDLYELDTGKFPSQLGDLFQAPGDLRDGTWHGPYLKKRTQPVDPWGHGYIYQHPGQHNPEDYDLSSMGPDGRAGTDDDLTNWSSSK